MWKIQLRVFQQSRLRSKSLILRGLFVWILFSIKFFILHNIFHFVWISQNQQSILHVVIGYYVPLWRKSLEILSRWDWRSLERQNIIDCFYFSISALSIFIKPLIRFGFELLLWVFFSRYLFIHFIRVSFNSLRYLIFFIHF